MTEQILLQQGTIPEICSLMSVHLTWSYNKTAFVPTWQTNTDR